MSNTIDRIASKWLMTLKTVTAENNSHDHKLNLKQVGINQESWDNMLPHILAMKKEAGNRPASHTNARDKLHEYASKLLYNLGDKVSSGEVVFSDELNESIQLYESWL